MLGLLKQKALAKKLSKQLKKRDYAHRNSPIKNIGFLVEEAFFDDVDFLFTLGKELNVSEDNIKIYTFSKNGEAARSFEFYRIVEKDFNWLGEIKTQDVIDFVEKPFDALIAIHDKENILFKNLVALSNAYFKIGFKKTDEPIFDMVLDVNPLKKEVVIESLRDYLKILKKI